jgi:hypothetical protein
MITSFDVLIVCHEKDYPKLPVVISSIKSNVESFNKIHIITNTDLTIDDSTVVVHHEKNVLDINLKKLKYRPTWIYQQLLKLLQNVTQEWYLVIDADTVVTNKLMPIVNGKGRFYFNQNEQNYEPYFDFAKKLKIKKVVENTFISEIMLFNQNYVKELFSTCGLNSNQQIVEFMYENIKEKSHLSEYELYGNFIQANFPNEYDAEEIYSWGLGKGSWDTNFWNQQRMEIMIEAFGKDYDLMSFHTFY